MTQTDSPLVSIIIPTFNRGDLISETLQSVQAQTYQNWECVVVDDGSHDSTEGLITGLTATDPRFKFYKRHREPKGAPTCRNIGMEKSNGDYIVFLDSDDLLADFCLERRLELFAKRTDCDFLVFQSAIFNNSLKDTNRYFNVENGESDLNRFLRTESLWAVCGAIYKSNSLEDFKFNESCPFWQDVDFAVGLLLTRKKYYKFFQIPPDAYIRQTNTSVSRNGSFSKTTELLGKRIQILLSFKKHAKNAKCNFSKQEDGTLYNFLYILCSRYLIEYGSHKNYLRYWFKTGKSLRKLGISWAIGYAYQYLLYWRKYSIYFIKIKTVYKRIFEKYIPDMDELEKCKLHQVSF